MRTIYETKYKKLLPTIAIKHALRDTFHSVTVTNHDVHADSSFEF